MWRGDFKFVYKAQYGVLIQVCGDLNTAKENYMKNKTIGLTVAFFVIFSVSAFAQNSSSSQYLFQQNFAGRNISKVTYDVFGETGWYLPNIGFSAGKRIIYDGFLPLLDSYLPDSALAVLNKEELRLLRNTIYAKYGMIFQSNDLRSHFQQFSWYNPRSNNVEAQLTYEDKWNIEHIQVFENARPNSKLNKKDLVGFWATPTDAWKGNEIAVNRNDTIIADLQEENRSFDWNWKGSYRIENGFLVVLVKEQYVGTPDFLINSSWRWPNGVTYSRGIVVYNEPIKLVFPVATSDRGDLQIGSIHYTFFKSSVYK